MCTYACMCVPKTLYLRQVSTSSFDVLNIINNFGGCSITKAIQTIDVVIEKMWKFACIVCENAICWMCLGWRKDSPQWMVRTYRIVHTVHTTYKVYIYMCVMPRISCTKPSIYVYNIFWHFRMDLETKAQFSVLYNAIWKTLSKWR